MSKQVTPPTSPTSSANAQPTPLRHSKDTSQHSKTISGDHIPEPAPSSQPDLKEDMKTELADATWEIPAEDFAYRLSRKTRICGQPFTPDSIDSLSNYEVTLRDDSSWTEALTKALLKSQPVTNLPSPSMGETGFYKPLSDYFNRCLSACKAVKPKSKGRPCYYGNLRFHPWDTPTRDGIRGAKPLKPDVVGGGEMPAKRPNSLWWRTRSRAETLEIPVEIKDVLAELIAQCATYARALMDARPHRQFALVISYQQTKKELRFLIFHAGGVTSSKPLDPSTDEGHEGILRLFLSLLTWETHGDAGLPEWGNDFVMFARPNENSQDFFRLEVQETLYDRLCLRGRGPKVQIVARGAAPSVPPASIARTERLARRNAQKAALKSSPLTPQDQRKISRGGMKAKAQSEPHLDGVKDRLKNIAISDKSSSTSSQQQEEIARPCRLEYDEPKFVEQENRAYRRALADNETPVAVKTAHLEPDTAKNEMDMLSDCAGQFAVVDLYQSGVVYHKAGIPVTNHLWLEGAVFWPVFKKPRNLADVKRDWRVLMQHIMEFAGQSLVMVPTPEELFRAIVHASIGYRNIMEAGFQHRDISIGNVLWKKDGLERRPAHETITRGKYFADLQRLVQGLSKCHGFIIDGDMSVRISEYFLKEHKGTRSGTEAFMSTQLLRGLSRWHSPVDDLWSLFYVAQWAAVLNRSAFPDSKDIPNSLADLQGAVVGSMDARDHVLVTIISALRPVEYGTFLPQCSQFFFRWWSNLAMLQNDWNSAMDTFDEKKSLPDHNLWLDYANQGALQLVELFKAVFQGVSL